MLNINQNFDLKAPVFNFDRDYFNSVEELKAYDTNNVPDHFVTNVAGMLYQFTNGKWWPILGTTYDGSTIFVGGENTSLNVGDQDRSTQLGPGYIDIYGSSQSQHGSLSVDEDTGEPTFSLYDGKRGMFDFNTNGFRISSGSVSDFKEISLSINDTAANDDYGSLVHMCLTDDNGKATINASDGFRYEADDGYNAFLDSEGMQAEVASDTNSIYARYTATSIEYHMNDDTYFAIGSDEDATDHALHSYIALGPDNNFKLSRPNNTEGGIISGIKSLTAFANPSATKVWATDGSTANLPTKFSDLTNDSIYIKENKGETDSKFKIDYNDGDILRSRLIYKPRTESVGISELAMLAYDTSGTALSQIRIRPEDNADDGQYVIQIQDVKGGKQVNRVSSLYPNGFSHQNFVDNTTVRLNSNELSFGPGANDNDFQAQLKINKEGITKTNGKATEVFAANGSIIDLTTYTNYFNGTTTADKLKSKAVEVTDDTNSVTVSPTGITATNSSTEGSIKMLTNKELTEEEQADGYSQVDISLTDSNNSTSINPGHGFTYTNQNLRTSINKDGLTVETLDLTTEGSGIMSITHNSIKATEPAGSARLGILPNRINITGSYENTLTIEAPYSTEDYSEISLSRDPDIETTINAEDGFIQTGPVCTGFGECHTQLVQLNRANIHFYKKDQSKQQTNAKLGFDKLENFLLLGNDQKFKISRPVDDTEGSTITGIKSIVAFSDPSNTKVFATDGSIVDLSTKADASDLDAKANASDVLLKKSATGGYYIEENSKDLGQKAFAANDSCTASSRFSFAEGAYTKAVGECAHAEGNGTTTSRSFSHVQGVYNVNVSNGIHTVGIGTSSKRKNAEYIYLAAENNTAWEQDPKNGYKYLIGVGGYDGISTDNTTYKSVQEVIADLTARIEQLETKVKALEDANTPA